MMNMMISTSMTSINGVMLISIIGSPAVLSLVVCIAMAASLLKPGGHWLASGRLAR